ncbi:MAG: hypothetical protein KAV00_13580 [Phycisphaerae bacterium]|nr:hypothetical protein [Phycisphaerae bacterium]
MQDSDIPQYLANVLYVARADGTLHPNEENTAEEIRAELKAKKRDFNQAQKMVSDPNFSLKAVGRYSEKIRNIEDMVFLAFADGELAESEKGLIVQFAREIGITQKQINEVLLEAKSRAKGTETVVPCPSCQKQIPASSRYCPECGAQIETLGQPTGTKLEFDYPSKGIAIEFPESSSANFHAAIAAAQRAPDFQKCERGRKKWFLAAWPNGKITDTMDLIEGLKGLRNRKVYVDGEPKTWDEVFGFLWCFRQRQEAYRPTEYCFGMDDNQLNVWGCKQARMDWTNWASWFSYGQFRKKDIFAFDKERIRHELESNLYKVRFCPCLRTQLVTEVLRSLPDEVRVGDRTGWKYNENYEEGPNSIKVVQKTREDGYTYTNEFFSDGVRPTGPAVALDILKKAFKVCAIDDVNVKQLKG